jgi:hypothetical protein
MKRLPPKPYRTMTPWTGFTPREKKRSKPLVCCPSGTCRRAKQCLRAVDGLYCLRTHLSPKEARAMAKKAKNANPGAASKPLIHYSLPSNPSLEQAEAYRIMTDMLVADIEIREERMTAKWKRGDFDHLYGPYDPRGVLMTPPKKEYVEP